MVNVQYCYKLIRRFRVTGLFTGQYTTAYCGTITETLGKTHTYIDGSRAVCRIGLNFRT